MQIGTCLKPWFKWLNRERIILLIGCLALLQGTKQPWYSLPPKALDIFEINLSTLNAGRGLAALLAALAVICVFFPKLSRLLRLPWWGALGATLLFPYLITNWCPNVNFLATAYDQQGRQVAQHIERNFPQIQSQWKQNISLDSPIPIPSTANFLIKDSRFFQASSWDQFVVEGLGYSNSFFSFIGRGWVLTLVGLGLCSFAFYLLSEKTIDVLEADIYKLLPWASLEIAILLALLLIPNFINYNLSAMFAKGNYAQVFSQSRSLLTWHPPFQGDSGFLKRMAEAGFYAGNPDPALLSFAQGLESYQNQDFLSAETYFREALERQPANFLARSYLASALLNRGLEYFNASESQTIRRDRGTSSAIDLFEQALSVFPDHLEALYGLMLATVVNGEFAQSARVAQQLITTQQYPQQPNLALLGQARLHIAWSSYRHDDINQSWAQYRQSIDPSTWEKASQNHQSTEEEGSQ